MSIIQHSLCGYQPDTSYFWTNESGLYTVEVPFACDGTENSQFSNFYSVNSMSMREYFCFHKTSLYLSFCNLVHVVLHVSYMFLIEQKQTDKYKNANTIKYGTGIGHRPQKKANIPASAKSTFWIFGKSEIQTYHSKVQIKRVPLLYYSLKLGKEVVIYLNLK